MAVAQPSMVGWATGGDSPNPLADSKASPVVRPGPVRRFVDGAAAVLRGGKPSPWVPYASKPPPPPLGHLDYDHVRTQFARELTKFFILHPQTGNMNVNSQTATEAVRLAVTMLRQSYFLPVVERQKLWEEFADRLSSHLGIDNDGEQFWSSSDVRGSDGAYINVGAQGKMLIFGPDGNLYLGLISDHESLLGQLSNRPPRLNYLKLKYLAPIGAPPHADWVPIAECIVTPAP